MRDRLPELLAAIVTAAVLGIVGEIRVMVEERSGAVTAEAQAANAAALQSVIADLAVRLEECER